LSTKLVYQYPWLQDQYGSGWISRTFRGYSMVYTGVGCAEMYEIIKW